MTFRLEEDCPDPEHFIDSALRAKVDLLDAAISAATDPSERMRLMEIRERYRLRAGIAPSAPAPMAVAPEPPAARRPGMLPAGAIPQPRKYGKPVEAPASRPMPKQRAAPADAPAGGMASFLKSIQSSAPKPQSTAPEPARPPAEPAPRREQAPPPSISGPAGMMGFLKSVQSTSKPPEFPEPAAPASFEPPPSAPQPAPEGGSMLAYLQKKKSGEPDEAPPEKSKKKEAEPEKKDGELHSELEGLFDELK